MYTSPYDTTICKRFRVKDKAIPQITEKLIAGELYNEDGVFYVTQEHPNIEAFSHPLIIKHPANDENLIVVDARGISSVSSVDGTLRKTSDLVYQSTRARLIKNTWMDGNTTDILNMGDLQVGVFAKMLSDTLTRRLNLDVYVQTKLTIISAYYYINLFFDGIGSDEDVLLKHAKRISRSTGHPIADVLELITQVGDMKTLDSFVAAIAANGDSVRLEKMSPAVLYSMMGGMWFGSNAVEQSSVALEHPPTFVAMLYMAVGDRSYRKTVLAQLAERVDRKKELSKILISNVSNAIRG